MTHKFYFRKNRFFDRRILSKHFWKNMFKKSTFLIIMKSYPKKSMLRRVLQVKLGMTDKMTSDHSQNRNLISSYTILGRLFFSKVYSKILSVVPNHIVGKSAKSPKSADFFQNWCRHDIPGTLEASWQYCDGSGDQLDALMHVLKGLKWIRSGITGPFGSILLVDLDSRFGRKITKILSIFSYFWS